MTTFRQARSSATLGLVWKTLSGAHRRRSVGGGFLFLPAILISTTAMASTLHEGDFVREGRSCVAPNERDRLTSNGHSVSPPGQQCRVISRTSTGGYYPIFNQRCTGRSAAAAYRMDVQISAPDRIVVRKTPNGRSVAYRHCPSAAHERAAPLPR